MVTSTTEVHGCPRHPDPWFESRVASVIPNPNACRHCDTDERDHCRIWHPVAGFHNWEAPTDRERLFRMKARRLLRLEREGRRDDMALGD